MKIDMHYYGTYAAAMCAGVEPSRAARIAKFAQFVDDQASDGYFYYNKLPRTGKQLNGNGEILHYRRTAHKGLDYAKIESLETSDVWPVFHFPVAEDADVCSWICGPFDAHDLRRAVDCNISWIVPAVTGIIAHMLLDSYAHQGFYGIATDANKIENLVVHSPRGNWLDKIAQFFGSSAIEEITTIGHGAALSLPDRCNALYEYDQNGRHIVRDNREIYRTAFKALIEFFGGVSCGGEEFWNRLFILLDAGHQDSYLDIACTYWQGAIRDGVFGQAHDPIKYIEPQPGDDDFYEFVIAAEAIRAHYKTRVFPARGMVY